MTIRDLVTAFVLADGTVASLIGTRLYPDVIPSKATYPAVKIQVIDVQRPGTLRSQASLATARIQFDVYAGPTAGGSRGKADVVGAAIRRRLLDDGLFCTLTDTTTSPSTVIKAWMSHADEREGPFEDIDGGLSEWSADYFVQYQTNGGAY